jgi:hypothetical protein
MTKRKGDDRILENRTFGCANATGWHWDRSFGVWVWKGEIWLHGLKVSTEDGPAEVLEGASFPRRAAASVVSRIARDVRRAQDWLAREWRRGRGAANRDLLEAPGPDLQ